MKNIQTYSICLKNDYLTEVAARTNTRGSNSFAKVWLHLYTSDPIFNSFTRLILQNPGKTLKINTTSLMRHRWWYMAPEMWWNICIDKLGLGDQWADSSGGEWQSVRRRRSQSPFLFWYSFHLGLTFAPNVSKPLRPLASLSLATRWRCARSGRPGVK